MTARLTKKELLRRLKDLKDADADAERAHIEADKLLLAYINDPAVTAVFQAIEKWYA